MYNNEEMNAINATLGQGFVLRLSDYIMNKRKTPILVQEVSDGYVSVVLRYKSLKDGNYMPVAFIEHYVRSENGLDKMPGKNIKIGDACEDFSFENLKDLTFKVNVPELIQMGKDIKINKH